MASSRAQGHQPGRVQGRAYRHLRAVRLREVDDDPLHQPLEEHQDGQIIVDGTELTDDIKHIDQIRREVGMVFQHFNLFPHLTVLENCCLAPIWVRRMPRKEAEQVAMQYLEKVKIPEQARKYPGQLSGASSSALRSPAACA